MLGLPNNPLKQFKDNGNRASDNITAVAYINMMN